MAIEQAVMELTKTIKKLIETLITERQVKVEFEKEKEPLASKNGTS